MFCTGFGRPETCALSIAYIFCKCLNNHSQRRAEKVDSSRQLDRFGDLNLGESDEEVPYFSPASVVPYASMLDKDGLSSSVDNEHVLSTPKSLKDGMKKPKKKRKNKGNKVSKWADKCMYAELLEMAPDTPMSEVPGDAPHDGLPSDLESGWVAVGPVPVGKRCLAVTHQSVGLAGAGAPFTSKIVNPRQANCHFISSPKYNTAIATFRKGLDTALSGRITASHHTRLYSGRQLA